MALRGLFGIISVVVTSIYEHFQLGPQPAHVRLLSTDWRGVELPDREPVKALCRRVENEEILIRHKVFHPLPRFALIRRSKQGEVIHGKVSYAGTPLGLNHYRNSHISAVYFPNIGFSIRDDSIG